MQSLHEIEAWTAVSNQDRAAILEQLEKLLSNPYFHNSKRYPSFLKFVVCEALEGRAENLKERTIGIEVFGRDPDYDTTEDPIVRVTAAEIRKRIALYYQDPGHEGEIRLQLPLGSYLPQFSWPKTDVTQVASPTPELPPANSSAGSESHSVSPDVTSVARSRGALLRKVVVTLAAVVAVGLGGMYLWKVLHPTALEAFWRPFFKTDSSILFCIADQNQYSTIILRHAADPQRQETLSDRMITVIIDDVGPLVNIAGMLQVHGKGYYLKAESTVTLTDLRQGPSVLIGAFDNGWTLRLTAPLRYHFANNPEMTQFWIEDRNDPTQRKWLLDRKIQQESGTYKDFAIVSRFTDPTTDRPVLIAAGIGRGGTVAAGEFLVDPRRLNDLANLAPKDWASKNIEVVLETQVIDGRSGPPRIAAVHVW